MGDKFANHERSKSNRVLWTLFIPRCKVNRVMHKMTFILHSVFIFLHPVNKKTWIYETFSTGHDLCFLQFNHEC